MTKPRKTLQNDRTLSALQQQLNYIKRETNPVVHGRRARGNPKPVQNKSVYVNRVCQLRKTSTGGATNLSNGDIAGTLGIPTNGSYYVDWIKIWNTTLGGYIDATLDLDNLTVNTPASGPNILCGDQGTGAALAGVHFDIPASLSVLQISGATTAQFASTAVGGTVDVVLYQIGVRVAMA